MEEREDGTPGVSATPADFLIGRSKGGFDWLDYWLEKIGSTILTVMFLVMITVGFLQVICRYFLQFPLFWSEELIRYLFVWTTFLGAGVAAANGLHIEIDVLSFALEKKDPTQQERIIRRIRIIGTSLVLIFLAYYNYLAGVFLVEIKSLEQTSTAMGLDMVWPMSAILVGGLLMLFHYLARIIRDLKASWVEKTVPGASRRRKT